MVEGNYGRIIERIASSSGIKKEEIEEKIESKRSKLSGLISKEGAAQVVAAELGISFENEKLKIDELLPGMRKVNTLGKVFNLFPIRTFTTKKGEESKVVNFWIGDNTSNVKVVLWDTNLIELIEKGEIEEGTVVEINNGTMRDSELHLGSFSEIKPSKESIGEIVTEKTFKKKNLSDFNLGENASVRAFVVQAFEPRVFFVCPECNKKAEKEGDAFVCSNHGKVVPEKRGVANLVIDDGTDTMRAVLFSETLQQLGFTELENTEIMIKQRESVLGKEMVFSGTVRNNSYFNNSELIVESIKEVNPDEIISELEK